MAAGFTAANAVNNERSPNTVSAWSSVSLSELSTTDASFLNVRDRGITNIIKAMQATLDSFQNWADLAYRLGARGPGETGRIALVARNAQGAAKNDPQPIREWLTSQAWIDPTLR